ncbi:unnamed protein product [Haemonchus placei]|uniref:ATP-dependent DNA helicase n=1 Tax=Haemonchus placei TaxID=6290 RepID=A0A0N4W1D4_HAEPC|nr:unnamed protein product [Haemonchus placei]
MLCHFNVTLTYIKIVCMTATGETAAGFLTFLTLKKIDSAIARFHNITLESSLPAESIDLSDIPTIEEIHVVTGVPVPIRYLRELLPSSPLNNRMKTSPVFQLLDVRDGQRSKRAIDIVVQVDDMVDASINVHSLGSGVSADYRRRQVRGEGHRGTVFGDTIGCLVLLRPHTVPVQRLPPIVVHVVFAVIRCYDVMFDC